MTRDANLPALIGIAHGSRNPASARVTEGLVAEAGRLLGVEAHAAYLESFASPSVSEVASSLASHGYTEAIGVPLLFTSAYHANEDAPEAIAEAAKAHGMRITQAPVIGCGEDLAAVLVAHLEAHEAAGSGPDSGADGSAGEILLLGVGSSRKGSNEAVDALGELLAARLSRPVTVRFATCAPKATEYLAHSSTPGTLLPLFTAPGLLLDQVASAARDAGWQALSHLGASLAPLIAERYREARAGTH